MRGIPMTYPAVLRTAGWHQTDTGLIWCPPAFVNCTAPGKLSVQRAGIRIKRFEVLNSSGGTINVGIGTRYINRIWQGGRLSADGATYTDGTTSLQSSTATFTCGATGADQTGIVFGCQEMFDWLSINFTTAETNAGGSTVVDHTVYYSTTSSGVSAWSSAVTTGLTDTLTTSDAVWTAIVRNFVWNRPADWAVNDGTLCGGDLKGKYLLRVGAAHREATDVAPVCTGAELGRMYTIENVADNGIWENEIIDYFDEHGDGIVAYFGTANAANRVYVEAEGA